MKLKMQKESTSLWMNKRACAVWYVGQNPSVSMYEAEQDFVHTVENFDNTKVSEDKTEILFPIEKFV